MNIDVITQYILTLTPAITAVIGIVVALGVGIGKIKKANSETLDAVKNTNKAMKERQAELEEQNVELKLENREIKQELRKLMAKVEHIHFVDEKED